MHPLWYVNEPLLFRSTDERCLFKRLMDIATLIKESKSDSDDEGENSNSFVPRKRVRFDFNTKKPKKREKSSPVASNIHGNNTSSSHMLSFVARPGTNNRLCPSNADIVDEAALTDRFSRMTSQDSASETMDSDANP